MKTPTHRPWLAFLFALALLANPNQLHAQLTKIFVASYGNDANDGSRGSPKRNFQAAHNAVATGGQIVVLDTAGYGHLTITKSLSVTVPPGVNGFVTATAADPTGIHINAGYGSVVSLRGLIIEGVGGGNSGYAGVSFLEGTLYLDDCVIRNFGGPAVAASQTPANSVALLVARNVQVRNCEIGFYGGFSGAESGAAVGFILTECAVNGCNYGIYAQAINATAFVQMTPIATANTPASMWTTAS
jgi:hypothetical protein